MNNVVYNFEEFLAEANITVKRKYTEKYPAKKVSSSAAVREKVLSFVKEKESVTQEEMMEFLKSINEETGGNTSRKWLNKNTEYFKVSTSNGTKTYRLSALGEKVHRATQQLNKS